MAPYIRWSALLLTLLTLSNAVSLDKRAVTPPTTGLPTGWTYKGCYTEGSGTRALTGASYVSNTAMTGAACITFCDGKGMIYAGTEYSGECFCGNSLKGGSAAAPSESECNMGCSGDAEEACGGPNRLTLFTTGAPEPAGPTVNPGPPGWGYKGCYTDGGARTLTTQVATEGGAGALTVAKCTTACKAGNYKYAGVEYSGECFCGNVFSNGGGPAPDGEAQCNMVCNGNQQEYCGGPNRLNLYEAGAAPATTEPATTEPATTEPATTTRPARETTTTEATGATGLPAGWSYKGCWVDNANGRILVSGNPIDPDLTVEKCIATCRGKGYSVAGMEYSSECFCGNAIIQGGEEASSESDCNMNCGGNANQKCGGPNRMSIYADGDLEVFQPPQPQVSGLPGNWKYNGCITEGNNVRAFPYQTIDTRNNSVIGCISLCQKWGYYAAGMEYGEECYCGDQRDQENSGSTEAPETDCSTPCPGDASYLCGGALRLSYYIWDGEGPLANWNYASGNAAGKYEFLIGGPVIPLITQPAVNGKVVMVEKYGTGPPNSTGAYELDVSRVDSFDAAWREMRGVKTDVFCSAGLTLPDKAGRLINIGGWSFESTFGVRLYWPDGSPGVKGVRDWQENVQELSLQDGRWYPTAMIMANGSILVAGGQEGSNGAPVPSLEILPKPAGGFVYDADYLRRTDPYNLYPFLFVLPSGGIFIQYYNEARVLDEVTLDTIKTLPKTPSAVNNDLGGRTYPFEGTAVILPQVAPYSDPLTVLLCGGSTPGAAVALDNCISIQPDAPDAQWQLERMPSKRVMSCISALPDGTYLITNGAHQGNAGFGLATDPNRNAVLYDPTKPVGSRMTVMANTTIARMYHSESVLMQDGRVLISGSDPEDNVHPQEYRTEVFVPPYLLSGAARPTFTLGSKSVAYGATFTVTVTGGAAGDVRVSLIGAESSTHGNTMGQRTIFPAVSCAGATCTVTAPPNAYVCPPGWFMLFVLDGPTPSEAQWIRIGGDPAQLGNWPDFPDFDTPGI